MSEYDIYVNAGRKLWDWVSQQPNLTLLKPFNGERIICQFNHTPEEEIAFKQNVANQLFQLDIGNNTFENLLPYWEVIQSDSLIYITEQSITKTNIGTTFVDLYTDYGGRNFFVDLTSYTKIRYHVNANIPGGSGTQNLRIVDNGNINNVLMDIVITNGQNVGTITIPDPSFKNFRGRVRIQVKSTSANDDPTYDRIILHALRPNRS